ncbi:hypothetical protein EV13_1981 [Prochlorococcus sp. MIT 0702]|nr:hypothetical protein EV13_1981 [Prochlorococcus sp. MIT 0702]KGG28140.1 hypothetical protein EV12_0889 [Prochlorococcus sp. MIT 0701]
MAETIGLDLLNQAVMPLRKRSIFQKKSEQLSSYEPRAHFLWVFMDMSHFWTTCAWCMFSGSISLIVQAWITP